MPEFGAIASAKDAGKLGRGHYRWARCPDCGWTRWQGTNARAEMCRPCKQRWNYQRSRKAVTHGE